MRHPQFGAGPRGRESCAGALGLGAMESPVATISEAVTDRNHQGRAAAFAMFPHVLDMEPRKTLGAASRKPAMSPKRRSILRVKEVSVAGQELSQQALDARNAMSDPMLFSDTASCRTGSITNSEVESAFSGSGTITESPSHSLILQASDPHPGMNYDLGPSEVLSQVGSWDDLRLPAPAKAQTAGSAIAPTIVPSTTSRKRSSRSRYGDGPDDDDDTEDLRKSPKRQDNTEPENQQRFACPFYRHDPFKYTSCLSYSLRRIKDVKQHIYRKHGPPLYYCAPCRDRLLIRLTWERNQRGILEPILAENQALVSSPMADHDLETVVIKTMTQVLNRFREESLCQLSQAASPDPSSPHTTASSPEPSSCAPIYNRKPPSKQLHAVSEVPGNLTALGVLDDVVSEYTMLGGRK
ncbi:unnamed protein product [Parascedosporium putredinis]|uniref:C2H2-type domain-containing protein n=1 Tax=Parascedosporium putredinis TaxID=1442378 RepID=A0A9P1MBQ9_9PEZI|nr:unnamed protein product [Parascedosporium putredinis]CAI8000050.1 unnamed protein product [Parascedosporium putredinis]